MCILKKMLSAVVCISLISGLSGIAVSAAAESQYGHNVSPTTAKNEYPDGEQITATLMAEKNGEISVKNNMLENSLAVEKKVSSDDKLVTPAQDSVETVKTENTGNTLKIVFIVLLVAAVVICVICLINKNFKVFLLILVCALVSGSVIVYMQFNALTDEKDITNSSDNKDNKSDNSKISNLSDSINSSIKEYSDGDYLYIPKEENLKYDQEAYTRYYNNIVTAFTYTDLSESEMNNLADSINATVVGDISGNINYLQFLVEESDLETIKSFANKLMESDNVMYASYDFPMEMSETSTDQNPWSKDGKMISDKGNENAPNGNDWWAEAIGAYSAWNYTDYAQPIKVGIIDSGFDLNHEDLKGNIHMLEPDYKDNSTDNHGTHVAGIIGAKNNNVGIRGIADTAELVCVDWTPNTDDKTKSDFKAFSTPEYLKAMELMINNKVHVINNSYGQPTYSQNAFNKLQKYKSYYGDYDHYLKAMLTEAENRAVQHMEMVISMLINKNEKFLIVKSAGNGLIDEKGEGIGIGIDTKYNGMSASISEELYNGFSQEYIERLKKDYNIDYEKVASHSMTVGAVGKQKDQYGDYNMTLFSNYGKNVDICAPGDDVLSTVFYTSMSSHLVRGASSAFFYKYEKYPGTSMSAPMVAGAAALVWSLNPDYSAGNVKELLISTGIKKAIPVGDGAAADQPKSYPMLNVGEAAKKAYNMHNPGTISGKVLTEGNTPIENAKVAVNGNTVYTNANGEFSISLPNGNYYFEVSCDGYQTAKIANIAVKSGKTTNLNDVVLKKEGQTKEKMYAAYLEEVKKIISQYGIGKVVKDQIWSTRYAMEGLCYAKLIDFDNDGVEELICVYGPSGSNGYNGRKYIKVFGFDGQKATVLLEKNALQYGVEGEYRLNYNTVNNKTLLLTKRNPQTYIIEEWSELKNNEFVVVKTYSESPNVSGKEECRIDGELVSLETFDAAREELTNSWTEITFENVVDKNKLNTVVDETNETLRILGYQVQTTTDNKSYWKTSYKNFLNEKLGENGSESYAFDLYDMNNDSIPELFVSEGSIHYSPCDVYTFINNQVKTTGIKGQYGLVFIDKNKGVIVSEGHTNGMGRLWTQYSTLDSNGNVVNEYFEFVGSVNGREWYYNEESVTEEVYKAKAAKYNDISTEEIGRGNVLTSENINSIIDNY